MVRQAVPIQRKSPSKNKHRESPTVEYLPKRTILIAVVGMSPAVLTETAWALAQQGIVPDQVMVITTLTGRDVLVRSLLTSGIWKKLRSQVKAGERLQFGNTGQHIKILTRGTVELESLSTNADSEAVADFMLNEIRGFTYDPECHIVASIAGGYKTMSALLYACMSLVGRETDRLTHVLVNKNLEQRKDPPFHFPQHASETKGVHLADLPFVPLRNLVPKDFGNIPGSFMGLVRRYSQSPTSRTDKAIHKLKLTRHSPMAEINETKIQLASRTYLLLLFLADRARKQQPPFGSFKDAADPFEQFRLDTIAMANPDDPSDWRRNEPRRLGSPIGDDDFRKLLCQLKKQLNAKGSPAKELVQVLPVANRCALDLPPTKIHIS